MKQNFNVKGMTCSACSAHVEKAVSKLPVDSVSVNLLAASMTVEYDENKVSQKDIINAVKKGGYSASLKNEEKTEDNNLKRMKKRLVLSFLFLIPLFYLTMGHMIGIPIPTFLTGDRNSLLFAFLQFLLTLPILIINRSYFINGFKALKNRAPNMDTLVGLGALSAAAYSTYILIYMTVLFCKGEFSLAHQKAMELYFESSAMILTLITLGKFLETRSKEKTTDAIRALSELSPDTANILTNGEEKTIDAKDIKVGDILVVRAGEKIPADGIIINGISEIDESAITGESLLVEKSEKDNVIAATICRSGFFTMSAQKVGEDTTFSKIIHLVEEAASSKAPIARLADKVSGIFVPVVILISIITIATWLLLGASFSFSLSLGISVLVVSCPCALGLATPTAIMVGTGKGAQNGILIRSAEALETLSKADIVVLDKTGTVTKGIPSVSDIVLSKNCSKEKLLSIALSIETPSEHILAKAIVEYAKENDIEPLMVEDFSAEEGMGVRAKIEGKTILAGNKRLCDKYGIDISDLYKLSEKESKNGKTPIFFCEDKTLLGFITLSDTERETSKTAVAEWKKMNLDVILLTGDNENTAKTIGEKVGIKKIIANVFPSDKEKEIRALQESGKKVVMIGDGINDAPALMRADIGISIGSGTDVALESSDIVLIKNDLLDAVNAMKLSSAVIKNIKQNLFWAFFYNLLGIPLAAGLFYPLTLSPMFAAAAMSFSSFFVVSNALRLKLWKPNK